MADSKVTRQAIALILLRMFFGIDRTTLPRPADLPRSGGSQTPLFEGKPSSFNLFDCSLYNYTKNLACQAEK